MKTLMMIAWIVAELGWGAEVARLNLSEDVQVTVDSGGGVRISRYPESWKGSLQVVQVPIGGIVAEVNAASCEALLNRIRGITGASPAAARLFDAVRRRTPILVRLDLTTALQETTIIRLVREKLEGLGIGVPNSLYLENALVLRSAEVEVTPAENSLSAIVGEIPELKEKAQGLITAAIGRTGFSQVEITASTFCAIWSWKRLS